jgi:hypothetical protein
MIPETRQRLETAFTDLQSFLVCTVKEIMPCNTADRLRKKLAFTCS